MPDITYDVGRVSFIMKGAWNLATAYEKLDAVTHNGSLYIAKQDVPGGTAITNTTYWVLAVEKGDQGETGNGIASIAKTGTAGNVDTYTITYTDGTTTTFTVTNGGVTTVNGRTGDVTGLAEEDGNYPLLNAGTADNLTPYSEDSGATQDIPFINEATGGGNGESVVDTGSYLQFKKKLGNTVGVNQLVPTNVVNFSGTGDASWRVLPDNISAISGHTYLIFLTGSIPAGSLFRIRDTTEGWVSTQYGSSFIWTAPGNSTATTVLQHNIPTGLAYNVNHTFHDLSIWFGSTDRIPSDLLSHPENWGRYYAGSLDYAAGYLDSADGTVLTSIGRNVWDEETESGYININTGENVSNNSYVRAKNYTPCIYDEYYGRSAANLSSFVMLFYDASKNYIGYLPTASVRNKNFTPPANAHFFRLYADASTYNHDITISLYYPGESGYDQYYPYSVLAEVDTGSEVLRSAGAVADEKTPDGTITRNVGEPVTLDLSTMTFTQEDGQTQWYSSTQPFASYKKPASNYDKANAQSGRFVCMAYTDLASNSGFGITSTGRLGISNDIYTNRASYTSVVFFCEAATPTTEQGTAFAENIPCDDFGSMYWTQTKGIPQGNEIFYPVDYKASIDTLYKLVNGDMSKIVTEDEYPEAPSSDGTYVLKATVSGSTKTYAWVAE